MLTKTGYRLYQKYCNYTINGNFSLQNWYSVFHIFGYELYCFGMVNQDLFL